MDESTRRDLEDVVLAHKAIDALHAEADRAKNSKNDMDREGERILRYATVAPDTVLANLAKKLVRQHKPHWLAED